MSDSDPFTARHTLPTATRPLLGLTILVVEDSRFACDAMRLLCLRSGARIRRADCLLSARRHLKVYRPSVLIVDLGLPDGSGLDLIADMNGAAPRISVILGISGDDHKRDAALKAGADGFIAKPITSLAAFQSAILAGLPRDRQPPGPRLLRDEHVHPDPMAYQDDMAQIADLLGSQPNDDNLDYIAQFAAGIADSADDRLLGHAARDLAQARVSGAPCTMGVARLAGVIQQRLHQRKAI